VVIARLTTDVTGVAEAEAYTVACAGSNVAPT